MDLQLWILVALGALQVFLLSTFLAGLRAFFRLIGPLIAKYTNPQGGLKMPSWKDALGVIAMRVASEVDLGSVIPGMKGAKK